jgi:hypothetical protein
MTENHTPSLRFKKSTEKPQSENSHDYVQKPQQNCTFMNSTSGLHLFLLEMLATTPI